MERFYQNVLGKRAGLKGPLKRAEALAEAQRWLRGLSAEEALRLLAKAEPGLVRGPVVSRVEVPLRKEGRPFAHPYYWAAFVLIGDPD
jgi:CHAT domain-containing protein